MKKKILSIIFLSYITLCYQDTAPRSETGVALHNYSLDSRWNQDAIMSPLDQ